MAPVPEVEHGVLSSGPIDSLRLVVGLGNPGRKYAGTRHNAGYMAVDEFARQWKTEWAREKKFDARIAKAERRGQRAILCKPETFMNASGEAVRAVVDFYKAPTNGLLVVIDDADLPLGEIRLRARGSSGGHHGLESIEQHLGTREFARLRIGIGRGQTVAREITGHVLAEFNRAERELMDKVLIRVCEQIECWMDEGISQAMNRFNGVIAEELK
ncbi:MAG TPA: aminoacyl-tRNA hydrolase [Candidatus Binatia bacterium]|nr:aminoacyl-tRNA hydrolase [Candidatus Binatia bacterium]